MLRDNEAFGGFSVPDVEQARQFYEETLGLVVFEEHGMLTLHTGGGGRRSSFPNPTTSPRRSAPANGPNVCIWPPWRHTTYVRRVGRLSTGANVRMWSPWWHMTYVRRLGRRLANGCGPPGGTRRTFGGRGRRRGDRPSQPGLPTSQP
jgi:catechol 2,3-dioxygenase-like lactoylglutathione lyase family enzyme